MNLLDALNKDIYVNMKDPIELSEGIFDYDLSLNAVNIKSYDSKTGRILAERKSGGHIILSGNIYQKATWIPESDMYDLNKDNIDFERSTKFRIALNGNLKETKMSDTSFAKYIYVNRSMPYPKSIRKYGNEELKEELDACSKINEIVLRDRKMSVSVNGYNYLLKLSLGHNNENCISVIKYIEVPDDDVFVINDDTGEYFYAINKIVSVNDRMVNSIPSFEAVLLLLYTAAKSFRDIKKLAEYISNSKSNVLIVADDSYYISASAFGNIKLRRVNVYDMMQVMHSSKVVYIYDDIAKKLSDTLRNFNESIGRKDNTNFDMPLN